MLTRRSWLGLALAAFVGKLKGESMALTFPITPTWIDLGSNTPVAYYANSRWFRRVVSIGSSLFACLSNGGGFAGYEQIYRSGDGGNTWKLPTPTVPLTQQPTGITFANSGLIYVATAGFPGTPLMATYDPATNIWSATSSVDFNNLTGYPTNEMRMWVAIRPDASKISVFQNGDAASGLTSIMVSVNSGAGWTRIGSFNGNPILNSWRYPYCVWMDTDGTVHIIEIGSDDTGTGWHTQQIWHVSVSTANVLTIPTSEQLIDTVEINNDGPPSLQGAYSMDRVGTTLAFVYPWQIETWYNGDGTPAIKAAIGDISGSALAPSWTVETITTNTALMPNSSKPGQLFKCMFNGSGQLEAYWVAPNPLGSFGFNSQLWQSTRIAPNTWTTPVLVYQTPADSDFAGDYFPLQGFDLLLDSGGIIRIMVDLTDGDFTTGHHWGPGYTAAPSLKGYVAAGGNLIGKGHYIV